MTIPQVPIVESDAARSFRMKVEAALKQVKSVADFRKSDEIVDYVITQGSELFRTRLDQQDTSYLVRVGAKLSGAYAWLGQQAAYARAERDVFEQKLGEVEKELTLKYLNNEAGYKVTKVRALIAADVQELKNFVIMKEATKNQWENILAACEKMVGFVQSAIKVKEGERFTNTKRIAP